MALNPDCTPGWTHPTSDHTVSAYCGCGWELHGLASKSAAKTAQRHHRFPPDDLGPYRDRHGIVWSYGDDGLLRCPTGGALFPFDHLARKRGPLTSLAVHEPPEGCYRCAELDDGICTEYCDALDCDCTTGPTPNTHDFGPGCEAWDPDVFGDGDLEDGGDWPASFGVGSYVGIDARTTMTPARRVRRVETVDVVDHYAV